MTARERFPLHASPIGGGKHGSGWKHRFREAMREALGSMGSDTAGAEAPAINESAFSQLPAPGSTGVVGGKAAGEALLAAAASGDRRSLSAAVWTAFLERRQRLLLQVIESAARAAAWRWLAGLLDKLPEIPR